MALVERTIFGVRQTAAVPETINGDRVYLVTNKPYCCQQFGQWPEGEFVVLDDETRQEEYRYSLHRWEAFDGGALVRIASWLSRENVDILLAEPVIEPVVPRVPIAPPREIDEHGNIEGSDE